MWYHLLYGLNEYNDKNVFTNSRQSEKHEINVNRAKPTRKSKAENDIRYKSILGAKLDNLHKFKTYNMCI